MSEQLTPNKGGWVRLEHEDGAEIVGKIIEIQRTADWKSWTVEGVGTVYDDGWTVAEILEKPFPPEGTFVKGVIEGTAFVGVVTVDRLVHYLVNESGNTGPRLATPDRITSWEVIA